MLFHSGPRVLCDGSVVLHCSVFDSDAICGENSLFARVHNEIPWEEHRLTMFGRSVAEPRRSSWHGDPGFTYTYSGRPRRPHPWTPTLQVIRKECETLAGTAFNGVLANLYRDGRDHMGWHSDDESVLGPEPVIASVSLGAERRMDFRRRSTGEVVDVVLPHGSVLIMSGASQQDWVHRIPRQARVTAPRINLTFRRLLWGT